MNVGRGLFRAWALITALWVGSVATAAVVWGPDQFKNKNYQYSYEALPGVDIFATREKPSGHYETWRSPAKEKLTPSFPELEAQYVDAWNKSLTDGSMIAIKFPDSSTLYLASAWTNEDQTYMAGQFWTQRWWRWGGTAGTWLAWTVLPPAALFLIGYALLWVGRGFAR
jgi:hypothetical protein